MTNLTRHNYCVLQFNIFKCDLLSTSAELVARLRMYFVLAFLYFSPTYFGASSRWSVSLYLYFRLSRSLVQIWRVVFLLCQWVLSKRRFRLKNTWARLSLGPASVLKPWADSFWILTSDLLSIKATCIVELVLILFHYIILYSIFWSILSSPSLQGPV